MILDNAPAHEANLTIRSVATMPGVAECDGSVTSNTSSATAETKASACDRVLAIEELLEHILLHVPIHDIISSAQLVCTSWNATIESSLHLQQGLFLKPIGHCSDKGTRVLNPAIKLVQRKGDASEDHSVFDDWEDASWRKMQVSQPPTQRFYARDRTWDFKTYKGPKPPLCFSLFICWYNIPGSIKLSWSSTCKSHETHENEKDLRETTGYRMNLTWGDCEDWVECETPMEVLRYLDVL